MFIQTQETPNPQTMKFIPNHKILEGGTLSFAKEDVMDPSTLPAALFKVDGVVGVFLAEDFISVTKEQGQEWDHLKPIVLATIMDHLVAGLPIHDKQIKKEVKEIPAGIEGEIIDLIETRVRPAVAQDGGDIIFKEFKDGIVYLELHGACSGCPSSTITLKEGIENMLKHYIPEVESVEAV